MANHKIKLISISLSFLLSCEKPFFFADIPDSEKKFIVVDGIITNQPGPYSIVISRSTGLNQENTFISDAQVFIEEENGLSENLKESEPGIYQTKNLQGIP
jgi:hypothetical protein